MTVLIFALCCVLGTAIYFKVVRPFIMLQRVEALFKAIKGLTTDVNDH